MKKFDALVCKPGPNQYTVDDSWKSTVPGYTEALSPWDNPNIQTVGCDASGNKYVLDKAVVQGTEISSVNAALDTSNNQWVVNITLNGAGTSAFGALTTSQYSKYFSGYQGGSEDDAVLDQIGITLDGDISSAPETNGALTSGSFQITGPAPNGFSQAEATQLQNVLKFGSLPLTFQLQSELYISPQTGHASLSAGLLAGILGLILVVIYLFYYYRGLGIVSVSSLVIAALLAYFSVVLLSKYQNFTMSLSAIAGLVVAIGITADSFIVYFERLRDEVRDGKALRPAVEAGWKRARRTILVSDTVSFLAAVLLYHFATSDVQGFAYTLGLTTIIDVIVVFLFTKPMVTLLAGTKFFSSGSKWSGLDPERLGAKTPWRSGRRTVRSNRTPRPPGGPGRRQHRRQLLDHLQGGMMAGFGGIAGRLYRGEVSVNFVRRQRMWYTISGLILLVCVVALLVKGLNFSVDFKGGSTFQFPYTTSQGSQAAVQGEISELVKANGGGDATVQIASSPLLKSQWLVTTKALPTTPVNLTVKIADALETKFNVPPSKMTPSFVGPTWGSQITTKALEALIIFLIVIVAYLSIAFEWRMAIAAFVALMHDIVITIGVYALTGFQVSPTTVIGLLTILGYSLYDTVVVFDKVRENTAGLLTSQRSTYSDAANLALNQTLVRSINTSITALIPVASILFIGAGLLGAGTLKDLALVLFVGMLSGTYSSICIATPVLADLKERQPEYKDLAVKVKRRLAGGRRAGDAGSTAASSAVAEAGPRARPDRAARQLSRTGQHDSDTGNDGDDDGVTVPPTPARSADATTAATRPASAGSAGTGGSRPQPRTGGSAQRRPGARKKRR